MSPERDEYEVTTADEAQHYRPASAAECQRVDDALGIEPIELRIPSDLAADLRLLAKDRDVIFPALIRSILMEHALTNSERLQRLRAGA